MKYSKGKKLQTSWRSLSYVMQGQVEEETSFAHTFPSKGQSPLCCQRLFAFLQHIHLMVISLVPCLLCLHHWDHLKVYLPRSFGPLVLGNSCLRRWYAECLDLHAPARYMGTERLSPGWARSCSVASRMDHWREGKSARNSSDHRWALSYQLLKYRNSILEKHL